MIVFENIGKKILALRRMLDDVKSFSALMLIFMIAYGTVSQGLTYKPSSKRLKLYHYKIH